MVYKFFVMKHLTVCAFKAQGLQKTGIRQNGRIVKVNHMLCTCNNCIFLAAGSWTPCLLTDQLHVLAL